jgi:purine-nucleoside phosphorylase
MTPHNEASKQDIAKVVLMPGDPMRSKYIAETFLTAPRLVNNVRGVQGYTGTFSGAQITVMASGMGMPSMGLYSYELFNVYDIDCIIRVGTAGAMTNAVKTRSLFAAIGASTNSAYGSNQFALHGQISSTASYKALSAAVDAAKRLDLELTVGNCFSTDNYYDQSHAELAFAEFGCEVCEMEAFALYINAMQAKKHALALMTVSNNILTGEEIPAAERERHLDAMIKLALETAVIFA